MRCPGCGTDVPAGKFCIECGTALEPRCPSCDAEVPASAKFCLECGADLRSQTAAAPAPTAADRVADPFRAKARDEAERRQLTVFFCDLVGSTELSSRLDPEDMREVIRSYQNTVAGEIARFEGHVAKFMGDGVLAYFGWPRAHEDAAEQAVRAGLAVMRALASITTRQGQPLEARAGIATGLVVVGDLVGQGTAEEQAVVGETPNLAARLQALAAPGQIVIAESTRRLLGDVFDLADLGTHDVKGIAEPVPAFAALGERSAASRFEARAGGDLLPMVGRDQELALLLERWALAKTGEGQGVLLVGEAGIGKSRINRALLDALAEQRHARIRYQCSPHHRDSALWPVIQQLIRTAGIVPDDPPAAKLDKLEALLGEGGDPGPAVPLMADLIGLDHEARYGKLELTPQAQRARTLEALVQRLSTVASQQPVLVVLEDAHWIDPTTLEMIDQTLDRIATARVLILLTSRPENQPELAAHPHVTRLTLNRLGRRGVEAIVARLGGGRLPTATVDTIIARTDGVPLYVEELTKAVLETGEATIPASLHDSLMARLDRLPEVKEIAQIAACIGREFDFSLLAAVDARADADLGSALDELAAAELIFRRGLPPHARYTFKHALVRDAAYESLLRSRRVAVHRRVASALEERMSKEGAGSPELIAQHLTAANEVERAVGFWRIAGDEARARYANREAVVSYDRALELLAATPEGDDRDRLELDIRVAMSRPLLVGAGYTSPSVEKNALRTVELARAAGDDANLWPALYDLNRYANQSTDFERGKANSLEMVRIGERIGDNRAIVAGLYGMGAGELLRGNLEAARRELDRGLDLRVSAEEQRGAADHFQAAIGCRSVGSLAHWSLGHPDRARRLAEEALQQARALDLPFPLAFALQRSAIYWQFERAVQSALDVSNEFLELQSRYPAPHWVPWVLIIRAWAAMREARLEAALGDLAEAWPLWHGRRSEFLGPYFRCLAAEVHLGSGQLDQTQSLLDQAFELCVSTDQHHWEAELYRTRAALLLAQGMGNRSQAERDLEAALDVARSQSARSLELRAASDLACLWAEAGERQKAHDLLAPVYGWFTEGFDTSDLIEAKALLDQLA